ncbi:rhodanese-like domain-containing protein [Oleidesulfovibrio sp.]|uniref:rhodanese-like domain-containing protein n=1 Tax=Oleidesulfovibrio sp. TaxID=2909707 RepID=UPI003A8A8F61
MQWKQFFTPVKSISVKEAEGLLSSSDTSSITVLDVRQPGEYEAGHIPGARLIPMADLSDKLDELKQEGPTLVYCAIGGRSRVAAQMLAGKGFRNVINMAGGFKDWEAMKDGKGWTSAGAYTQGLELFPEDLEPVKALEVAWGMEAALEKFYSDMAASTRNAGNSRTADMFDRLAKFEVGHKAKIENRYEKIAGQGQTIGSVAAKVAEGGLTTDEYMQRMQIDTSNPSHIAGFAIMIEAQAMDLYARASRTASDSQTKEFLAEMAKEEQSHMKQVSKLLDSLLKEQDNG